MLDACYTDPSQNLVVAGQGLDDLDRDLGPDLATDLTYIESTDLSVKTVRRFMEADARCDLSMSRQALALCCDK